MCTNTFMKVKFGKHFYFYVYEAPWEYVLWCSIKCCHYYSIIPDFFSQSTDIEERTIILYPGMSNKLYWISFKNALKTQSENVCTF